MRVLLANLATLLLLAGCGQTGPLYLPQEQGPAAAPSEQPPATPEAPADQEAVDEPAQGT